MQTFNEIRNISEKNVENVEQISLDLGTLQEERRQIRTKVSLYHYIIYIYMYVCMYIYVYIIYDMT